jgi:glycosyltransferase involved in cell wall biosynthesis
VALLDGRGQQELLKAVALTPHPEWHVLLVGDGRQKAALIKLAQQYKIAHRVHFTGYLSKSQLYQAYRVMDATFLAQAGNDASVRAAMEALFLHVPLVAVQGSALDEWVHENRWGVGVPQLHPAWIATKLLHMHEHYDEFCAKARDCGEYLRGSRLPEHEARETLAFYKKVGNL